MRRGDPEREAQRRAQISGAMRLSDEEAAKFWPIYDQYRLSTKALELRRLGLLKVLAENMVGMDDETASSIVEGGLAAEAEGIELKGTISKRSPISCLARAICACSRSR